MMLNERAAIQRWLRGGRRTRPMTGAVLPSVVLTAEAPLRRAIEEYVGLRPELARLSLAVAEANAALADERSARHAADLTPHPSPLTPNPSPSP